MKSFLLKLCRTLHIYLTLLGLLVMFFFSVTGFILNHDEWFMTAPQVNEKVTSIDLKWIENNDKLSIVEKLRAKDGIRGALASYDDYPESLSLRFESPGQMFSIEISKSDGRTHISNEVFSMWAFLGNLHRGHAAGPVWKWVLDITAILLAISCITGVVLWITLPRRRKAGIIALIVGIGGTIVILWLCTPGRDCLLQ